MSDPTVIVGASRTLMGDFQGELAELTASQLGATAIKDTGIDPESKARWSSKKTSAS